MKTIKAGKISALTARLCAQANLVLRKDVLQALKSAYLKEKDKRAKAILSAIISNAAIAKKERLAICQDTGLPCVFIELGHDVRISGDLLSAINKGVALGYTKAFLRSSVISDPISRGKPGYLPAVVHTDIIKGNKLKITVLPKGFGCENKTRLKMFNPTTGIDEIKNFVIEAVRSAGADACPPYIIGVGIGGTADYACLLAKKALLYPQTRKPTNQQTDKLEQDLLRQINNLNIGPMGLGGGITALAVNIKTYPTHIAGLPVAVNISCHALRSASGVL
jgi:fumarate hydratase subunit alpha